MHPVHDMKPFSNVLIATELSEHGAAAAAAGARIAHVEKARVRVFHALELPWLEEPLSLAPVGMTERDYVNKEEQRAKDELTRLVQSVPLLEGASTALHVSSTPAKTICKHTQDDNIDLVVVGTHKRTGASRLFMGSVAEKVARHAPCSVLVVPLGARLCEQTPTKILAATDFSAPSWRACDRARSLAVRMGADLIAFHALPLPRVRSSEIDVWPPADRTTTRTAEKFGERLVGRYGEKHDIRTDLTAGIDAAEAICKAAERRDVDLVVVGTMGRTGMERWLIGSVAERVVRQCEKPVLVIRSNPED